MKNLKQNILPLISLAFICVMVALVIYNSLTYGVYESTPFDDLGK